MVSASPSAAAPRVLPHQLVARDGRSSYIKRIDTLAGPGAYVIPSSFKTMEMNAQIREIHKRQFGREFARQQRRASLDSASEAAVDTSGDADADAEEAQTKRERRDIFLARRERLRELLEKLDQRRDFSDCSESLASPTAVTPFKTNALPQSPSLSCTSNYDVFVAGYRQHEHATRGADSSAPTESVRSPTSPCELASEGFFGSPRQHRESPMRQAVGAVATSPPLAPLTYRAFLATTSYSRRHARHQRPSAHAASSARPSTAGT